MFFRKHATSVDRRTNTSLPKVFVLLLPTNNASELHIVADVPQPRLRKGKAPKTKNQRIGELVVFFSQNIFPCDGDVVVRC